MIWPRDFAAGAVTQDGRLLSKCSLPTGADRPAEEIVRDMARAALLSLEQAGLERDAACALGVGVPGAVDARRGMVLRTTNLYWRSLPLGEQLKKLTGLPVYLGNDADCAALGEVHAGAARDYDSAVMITLGTGVGGGIVAHDRVFDGWNGGGTEAGHIPLILGWRALRLRKAGLLRGLCLRYRPDPPDPAGDGGTPGVCAVAGLPGRGAGERQDPLRRGIAGGSDRPDSAGHL